MTKPSFQRVILYGRQYRANQNVNETLCRLGQFLKTLPLEVFVDAETACLFETKLPVLPRDQILSPKDLIIVVGGDGSLLAAARMAVDLHVPVIGINRGYLGFLTDIAPDEFAAPLEAVLSGHYIEEKRFLLHAQLEDENKIPIFTGTALNDVVLARGEATHLVTFEVFIDDQFVSRFRSDGMIFATPTGSTAYALSAGGPIMHPQLNAIVMVPMFSHSLSSRPLVIDSNAKIMVKISPENEANLRMNCDGHESIVIKPGQTIQIRKHETLLSLLHPCDYHYYDTLRMKLGWEAKAQ